MAIFDPSQARAALSDLIAEFESLRDRSCEIRHELIEAPAERAPGFEAVPPEDPELEGRFPHDFRPFDQVGPPARRHYYFSGPVLHGPDLELFRHLASRAALCLEGLPGLGTYVEHPIEIETGREAETWMFLVHALAWERVGGTPLKATPSSPANGGRRHASIGEGKSWISKGIPGDCSASQLPEGVCGSSILAIWLILSRIDGLPDGKSDGLPAPLDARAGTTADRATGMAPGPNRSELEQPGSDGSEPARPAIGAGPDALLDRGADKSGPFDPNSGPRATRERLEDGQPEIPRGRQTRPMSLKEAGHKMGFKVERPDKLVSKAMKAGRFPFKMFSRQSFIFDVERFPSSVRGEIRER